MASLTILYDGACPLCLREVTFLRRRDGLLHPDAPRLAFVDIDAPGYAPQEWGGISYGEAMGRIHALSADGAVVRDVDVFRQAYALVGLGWLYAPTRWPLLRALADGAYSTWARLRLVMTGRLDLETLVAQHAARDSVAAGSEPLCASGRCKAG
jgi:predicted DCC family thiol-disulfide oxidoreductase YuxK